MQLVFHFTLLIVINILSKDTDPQDKKLLTGFGKSPAGGSPPSPRQNAVLIRPTFAGSPSNLFYCFSGLDAKKQYLQDVMSFFYTTGSMDWRPVEINGIHHTPQRVEYCYYIDNTDFVIWGGMGPDGFYDDMWAFNMQTKVWSEVFQSHERPSARQAAHFCQDGEFFYIFGGRTNDGKTNDAWKFHIPTRVWTKLLDEVDIKAHKNAPATRSGGGAFASGAYLYIFGGYTSKSDQSQNVYRLPVNSPTENDWKELPLVKRGTSEKADIVPRTEAGICWIGKQVYLYGGLHEETTWSEMANDVIVLDFTKNVDNAGLTTVDVVSYPFPEKKYQVRACGFVVCDEEEKSKSGANAIVSRRGFAFGGTCNGDMLGGMIRITLDANDVADKVTEWVQVSKAVDNIPSPRALHGVVGALGKLWVYGGQGTGGTVLNDLYSYDISSGEWKREEATAKDTEKPPALYDFGMCEHSGRLFIFGGVGVDLESGQREVKNDLWQYSIAQHKWSKMKPLSALKPLGRSGCFTKILHKNLFVFGGRMSDTSVTNEIWVFSLMTMRWRCVSTRYRAQLHTDINKIFEKGEFDKSEWQSVEMMKTRERMGEYIKKQSEPGNVIKSNMERLSAESGASVNEFGGVPPYILEKRELMAIHSKEIKFDRDGKHYEVDQVIIGGGVYESRESSVTLDYLILPSVDDMKELGARQINPDTGAVLNGGAEAGEMSNSISVRRQPIGIKKMPRTSSDVVNDNEKLEFLMFYGDPLPRVPYPGTKQDQYDNLPIYYRSYTVAVEDGFLSYSGLDIDNAKNRVNHWMITNLSGPVFEFHEAKKDLLSMSGGGAAYYKSNVYCFGGNIIGNKLPCDNQYHNQLFILNMIKNFSCSPGTKKIQTLTANKGSIVNGALSVDSHKAPSKISSLVEREYLYRQLHNSDKRVLSSLWVWDSTRRYTKYSDFAEIPPHLAFSTSSDSSSTSHGNVDLHWDNAETEFCVFCDVGMFAKKYNSPECTGCNPGSYNAYKGGLSGYHCVACPANTYNDKSAQPGCTACPEGSYCPVGSMTTTTVKQETEGLKDDQPPMYETNDKYSTFITLGCYLGGAIVGSTIAIICVCLPTKSYLHKADLFSDRHSNKLDPITNTAPKVLKKSRIGGFVAIMFLGFAVCAAVSVVVEFFWNNVTETKSVIAAAMEPNLDLTSITVRSFAAEIELKDYCGECVAGIALEDVNVTTGWGDCHQKFSTSTQNLDSVVIDQKTKAKTRHKLVTKCMQKPSVNQFLNPVKSCIVRVEGKNVEFAFDKSGGKPTLSISTYTEKAHSYSIVAKASVDTGIGFGWKGKKADEPKRMSARTLVALSPEKHPFKGAESTVFSYEVMPSLFTFPNDTRTEGYQIVASTIKRGTTAAEDEMNVKYGLSASIQFTQDMSVLLTNWVDRMKIGTFFANLMSTVTGFMGIFGSIVMVLEVVSTMKLPCANKVKESMFGKLKDDDEETVMRRHGMYAPVKEPISNAEE
ncbi:uncharacterized protein MONOS_3607 [Monocercomonoides exilis]|uniref:uncharacterized protein n=1 Tax=Monocercomonoides exilis TaxID=2049356 RepID=UPI003559AE4C|nr:hypothetical protein MONOS_3607 [Monocercomonoides exilis]|eukprot:MONOS_3607.1-p1 / transcript=MONOS_3607.1 / gene=MONOS_3607 / organism=Monocercomonoides_exilis_PA203 / gene_product=unspecified product / transcript_product=unspecified product / location=Mono_scaffold00086:67694-72301(-) / protein_length=1489 / sequence_SO=supercontig / SO=protein_coding / is_pseudo=false